MIRKRTKAAALAATLPAVFLAACASKEPAAPPPPPAAPSVSVAPAPPTPAAAPAAPTTAATPTLAGPSTDFADMANWLCRPGKADDACKVDLSTTVINADGTTRVESFTADPNAAIDCFYVYPTVSLDPFTFSDLVPGPEELSVVRAQFARLGASCRLFAPMYRQFSLGALRAGRGGAGVPQRGTREDANADVDGAWDWYLANENKGRPFVILGHSQGAGQIMRLVAKKVDGQPVQKQLLSVIPMGFSVQTPKEAGAAGGAFKSIPVCKSPGDVGCVISFSSFRADIPPSDTAGFGRGGATTEAICTNPAALGGGKGEPKAYISTAAKEWLPGMKVATPFVRLPGQISTECVRKNNHHYLEVTFSRAAADKRMADPGTDIPGADGKPDPGWGLHLIDANLAMGDLVDIVKAQGASWKKTAK
jgi:hypothetical protein